MRITYPSLLFAALLVAACGGGSSDAATQGGSNSGTQGPKTQAKSTGGLIEYYGDSTIWGWSTHSSNNSSGQQVAIPAPEAFRRKLPTTPAYSVVNEGVSGSTACGLLRGQDGHHPEWDTQLTKHPTGKWVIMNHGINDEQKGVSIAEYKSCLTELVRKAKAKGKEVVLETPNPISIPNDRLESYAAAMKEVAAQQGVNVIDQYAYLTDYIRTRGLDESDITPDGLHPEDQFYILKGEFAAREFVRFYP